MCSVAYISSIDIRRWCVASLLEDDFVVSRSALVQPWLAALGPGSHLGTVVITMVDATTRSRRHRYHRCCCWNFCCVAARHATHTLWSRWYRWLCVLSLELVLLGFCPRTFSRDDVVPVRRISCAVSVLHPRALLGARGSFLCDGLWLGRSRRGRGSRGWLFPR